MSLSWRGRSYHDVSPACSFTCAFATRPGLLPPFHVDLSSDPWSPDNDHGKTFMIEYILSDIMVCPRFVLVTSHIPGAATGLLCARDVIRVNVMYAGPRTRCGPDRGGCARIANQLQLPHDHFELLAVLDA
jgi:hypothetical protein